MSVFSTQIEQVEGCEEILELAYSACVEEGAVWFGYFFTPIFESVTSRSTFIWARGLPVDLQRRFFAEGYRDINPVPQMTFDSGYVLTWSKAHHVGRDDPKARRFFDFLEEYGGRNWAGFSLFGPRSRDAFACIRFSEDPDRFDDGRLTHIHTILQTAHIRICGIMDEKAASVALSDRERQVLEWMGRGKSSGEIGTILAISPETVKTYTKRIYDKLDTNDRVTATVRALKMGLVEL